MAQALPPLPKELRSVGSPDQEVMARRVDEWARGNQLLVSALRTGQATSLSRLAILERDMAALQAAGGGGSVVYGSPVALTVGGSNANGSSTDVPRADHKHALPAFGTTAGTFAEGNDSRFSGVTYGSPIALVVGGSNANGSNSTAARSDHKHQLPAFGSTSGTFAEGNDSRLRSLGSPIALVVGGANADGSNTTVARSDHKHQLPAFGTTPGTFAAGDHTHTGLGSGYVDVWDPDMPPASAHSQDDECTGGSIDAKWTLVDPLSLFNSSGAANGAYKLEKIGTNGFVGYYQAVPNTEFSILARVGLASPDTTPESQTTACLWVAQNLNSTSNTLFVFGQNQNGIGNSPGFRATSHTGMNMAGSSGSSVVSTPAIWYRLRLNGTSLTADYHDGTGWLPARTVTLANAPAYWGWGIGTVASAATPQQVRVRNIRVKSGSGSSAWNANVPGGLRRSARP